MDKCYFCKSNLEYYSNSKIGHCKLHEKDITGHVNFNINTNHTNYDILWYIETNDSSYSFRIDLEKDTLAIEEWDFSKIFIFNGSYKLSGITPANSIFFLNKLLKNKAFF